MRLGGADVELAWITARARPRFRHADARGGGRDKAGRVEASRTRTRRANLWPDEACGAGSATAVPDGDRAPDLAGAGREAWRPATRTGGQSRRQCGPACNLWRDADRAACNERRCSLEGAALHGSDSLAARRPSSQRAPGGRVDELPAAGYGGPPGRIRSGRSFPPRSGAAARGAGMQALLRRRCGRRMPCRSWSGARSGSACARAR